METRPVLILEPTAPEVEARRPLLMPAHTAGPYSTYRLFEWCMAVMMVMISITLSMPGDTMERAALKPIAQMGFNEANMATVFGCIGTLRVTALFLNGYINNATIGPKGAYFRATGAGVGALVFGQLTVALVIDAFSAHSPSFFIPVLGCLAGFEAISVYVAVLDGVSRRTRLGKALKRLQEVRG